MIVRNVLLRYNSVINKFNIDNEHERDSWDRWGS